jgi:2-oxoglutarate ferredoxin oxidoreductase subunit gamma
MKKAEVLLAGLGGQGVQLAGDILGESCALEGRSVSVLPSYGAEARGTLIRAEVVISDEAIVYPGALEPDFFVAFSQEAYDHSLPTLQSTTKVIYDPASVAPATGDPSEAKHYPIPAIQTAGDLGNAKAANMVMLGALTALSELISMSGLEKIVAKGPKRRRELSVKAMEKGFQLAHQQLEA